MENQPIPAVQFDRKFSFFVGLISHKTGEYIDGDIAEERVAPTLEKYGFDSFTERSGAGHWQGKQEPIIIVEVILGGNIKLSVPDNALAHTIAAALASACENEAVLWTVEPAMTGFAFAEDEVADPLVEEAKGTILDANGGVLN